MPRTSNSSKKAPQVITPIQEVRLWVKDWSLDDIKSAFSKIKTASEAELPNVLNDLSGGLEDLRELVNEAIDRLDDAGTAHG